MPSRIDTAVHTKAFDYPVSEHWGESRNVSRDSHNSVVSLAIIWAGKIHPKFCQC